MRTENWETLKRLADRMSGNTLEELYRIERSHDAKWELLQTAEEKYASLELTAADKKVVEALLELREDIDTTNNNLAYMAGIMDGIALVEKLGLLEI